MSDIQRQEADRLLACFADAGAGRFETDVLQPADVLLDLYGEDIRARAFVTSDPLRGEMMLRPDFTAPLAQQHMKSGGGLARYSYSGTVFRRQELDIDRPVEFLQTGFELFGADNPAAADAEVFAVISNALDGMGLRAAMGDIGILLAAVNGLKTIPERKAALLRHLWRPRRFMALLDRYAGRSPVPPSRAALLAASDPLAGQAELTGKRSNDEINARIGALKADAAAPPISGEELELLDSLMSLRETAPNVLSALRDIAVDMPAISGAAQRLADRMEALDRRGIDVENLEFETSYGRTSLEYYDGFVFGFYAPARPDWPPVATGGRYDALTRLLGRGRTMPAVGGVVRPELSAQLRAELSAQPEVKP